MGKPFLDLPIFLLIFSKLFILKSYCSSSRNYWSTFHTSRNFC